MTAFDPSDYATWQGLHVNFFVRKDDPDSPEEVPDTTNGGVTWTHRGGTVIGFVERAAISARVHWLPSHSRVHPPTPDSPALWIQRSLPAGREVLSIVPAMPDYDGRMGPHLDHYLNQWRHGGNYAASVDSRFGMFVGGIFALPVFDRTEAR